jgi:hypothetical protein
MTIKHKHLAGTAALVESLEPRMLMSVTLDVSAPVATAYEGGSAGSFVIHASQPVEKDTPVAIRMSGTARNGRDYQRIARRLVIPAGSDSIEVPVNVINDTTPEPNRTATLSLVRSRRYEIGERKASVQVMDDEPHVSMDFRDVRTKEGYGNAPDTYAVVVAVMRTGSVDEDLTVCVRVRRLPNWKRPHTIQVTIPKGSHMTYWWTPATVETYHIAHSRSYYAQKDPPINFADDSYEMWYKRYMDGVIDRAYAPALVDVDGIRVEVSVEPVVAAAGDAIHVSLSTEDGQPVDHDVTLKLDLTGEVTAADFVSFPSAVVLPAKRNSVTIDLQTVQGSDWDDWKDGAFVMPVLDLAGYPELLGFGILG